MLFDDCTFNVVTNNIPKAQRKHSTDGDITTKVMLTGCEVDDFIVRDSLVSGQSPRVRYQAAWRSGGIPEEITLTWAQWIGKPDRVIQQRDMTPEEIANKAQNDPDFAKKIKALLGL